MQKLLPILTPSETDEMDSVWIIRKSKIADNILIQCNYFGRMSLPAGDFEEIYVYNSVA